MMEMTSKERVLAGENLRKLFEVVRYSNPQLAAGLDELRVAGAPAAQ